MNIDLGIIVAMKEEADIIASKIGLTLQSSTPHNIYANADNSIVMLTPGNDTSFTFQGNPLSRVGKAATATLATILIEKYHPKAIINCGTAGGIGDMHMKVGDIIVANAVMNHDMRFPAVLAEYPSWGDREITLTNNEKLSFLKQIYKGGVVTSGDSFESIPQEWETIHKHNALAKDMEAAGLVTALEIIGYTNPCYVVKSVTDVVSDAITEAGTPQSFIDNFTLAMNNLSEIIKEMVENKEKLF